MPDPHSKPALFAKWFAVYFTGMRDMDEPLITGYVHTLLPKIVPDMYANFALRPSMKYFNLKRPLNIEATAMTICGTDAESPCATCSVKRGPFTKCMVLPGMGHGSCSNCRYNGQGTRCSFYDKCEYIPSRIGRYMDD